MKFILVGSILISASFYANAIDEEAFQKCVALKDVTLIIAEQADKGVTRQQLKSRVKSINIHPLIDFVYDFRGVKSNQDIAANQMENCLLMFNTKSKKK